MNTITKHTETFKKRDIQRKYLRNGDIKISEGTKKKWNKETLIIDTSFNGTFSLDSNGNLVYEPTGNFDLYQYIMIDSTPTELVANIPFRIEDKVNIQINNVGNLIINIE